MSYGKLGGGKAKNLKQVIKNTPKKPPKGQHFYAIGFKWKGAKKVSYYFKNPIQAKSRKEAIRRLSEVYSLPRELLKLRKIR